MKIFVTGGSGMVGRNLLDNPGLAGHHVMAPSSSQVDLRDRQALLAFVQENRPDLIVHCAGKVGGIQANLQDPVAFLAENLDMGMNLVLAARQAGIPRLLNLGSSCMYPCEAPNPLREDMLLTGGLEPTNEGYALAKLTVARLCQYVTRETRGSMRYLTIIPCNLYGPWDKFDPERAHLIPAVIAKIHRAMLRGVDTVTVWGDGSARREFLYAGDLADFIRFALGRLDTLPELMNLGLGLDHTILEYYTTTAQVLGWRGRFVHDLDKPVGMQRKVVDTSIQETLGWAPSTSLEEGIRKTFAFYQEHYTASPGRKPS